MPAAASGSQLHSAPLRDTGKGQARHAAQAMPEAWQSQAAQQSSAVTCCASSRKMASPICSTWECSPEMTSASASVSRSAPSKAACPAAGKLLPEVTRRPSCCTRRCRRMLSRRLACPCSRQHSLPGQANLGAVLRRTLAKQNQKGKCWCACSSRISHAFLRCWKATYEATACLTRTVCSRASLYSLLLDAPAGLHLFQRELHLVQVPGSLHARCRRSASA